MITHWTALRLMNLSKIAAVTCSTLSMWTIWSMPCSASSRGSGASSAASTYVLTPMVRRANAAPEKPLHKSMRSIGPLIAGVHGREGSSPLPLQRIGFAAASLDAASAMSGLAPPASSRLDRGRCP